jgi:hypothetical protein
LPKEGRSQPRRAAARRTGHFAGRSQKTVPGLPADPGRSLPEGLNRRGRSADEHTRVNHKMVMAESGLQVGGARCAGMRSPWVEDVLALWSGPASVSCMWQLHQDSASLTAVSNYCQYIHGMMRSLGWEGRACIVVWSLIYVLHVRNWWLKAQRCTKHQSNPALSILCMMTEQHPNLRD